MAPTHATFDFGQLTFGTTTVPTRSGGKTVRVGYGPTGQQVEFQLGTSPYDTLRCAWGADLANPNDPTSGRVLKLEVTDATKAFVQSFESATVAAANANSQAWFGRPTPNHTHTSTIKEQSGTLPNGTPRPDVFKLKLKEEGPRATKVFVTRLMGENGFTEKIAGSLSDIAQDSRVLVKARVANGVYFMNRTYGCSLEAASVLVVLDEGAAPQGGDDDFDMGDCHMVDATADDDSLP